MSASVLTLIASLRDGRVASAVDMAASALVRLGAHVADRLWLAPARACDIVFDELHPDQAEAAARQALDGTEPALGLDLIAQPLQNRRKQLLLADMESTIIANEMLDELADLLGLKEHVAAITRRAMNDEIDFAAALKERVALLKNLPENAIEEAGGRIRITPGAAALVRTMRAHGAFTVLVSGGFRVYTSRIRTALGFDLDVANELVMQDGRLAGTVREPILGRDAKLATLKRVAADRGLPLAAALAVGDGANDIAMIDAAGLGIAFHARPTVAARARRRIDHNDLTALLYAQGYREEEIVSGGQRTDDG